MMEPPLSELDAGFEPQQRARSNTWPLPRPDNFVDIKEEPGIKCPGGVVLPCGGVMGPEGTLPGALQLPAAAKKNSSRRNAWGNLSYADLITQAIQSAPEKRLTLSQIYEWMVQNVPYFKDKGDSNSSAGWKVSDDTTSLSLFFIYFVRFVPTDIALYFDSPVAETNITVDIKR